MDRIQKMVAGLLLLVVTGGAAGAEETERSIARTHRAISSAADAINRNDCPKGCPDTGPAELRKAVVHNAAARICLKKDQTRTAMFLTLKARKIAKDIIAAYHQYGG